MQHWGCDKIKLLTRAGKHIRAVTPFSAEMPIDKSKAAAPFQDAVGRLVPHIFHTHRMSFYPSPAEGMAGNSSPAADSRTRRDIEQVRTMPPNH
jgi:hypothetical protein